MPLRSADGAIDQPREQLVADVAALLDGPTRLVYVRGRDEAGHWGPLSAAWLRPPAGR